MNIIMYTTLHYNNEKVEKIKLFHETISDLLSTCMDLPNQIH